jgi:predicted RND superfamily exporter protein
MVDLWWTPRKPRDARTGRRQQLVARMSRLVPNVAQGVQAGLKNVFPFVQKFKYAIVCTSMAALAVCLYGMSQLHVDTDPKAMFPKQAKIRGDMDIADRNMLGSQTLKVYFDLGAENALQDPFVLKRVDELQKTIESKYAKHVVRTLSLVDVLKSSYQALNEDRQEMHVVPPTRQAVANTFFMFDNSNPVERRKMVSDDYSKAHIDVSLRNGGSYEYTKVFDLIQKDIDAATADLKRQYPHAKASVTGLFTLMMQGSDYLSWNALSSFGWASLTISVILLFIFGSLRAGLVSVGANAMPITLTFGLMGLFNVPLDFTTVLIAPIIIGLAVDDTVHFLVHYRHQVSVHGDVKRALVDTILEAGQSVTYTSAILALGLSVLAFSSSPGNANVGIYGALSVLVGWVCELLLTPSLILIIGLKFQKTAPSLQPSHLSKEAV